jgi:hypothetical protein
VPQRDGARHYAARDRAARRIEAPPHHQLGIPDGLRGGRQLALATLRGHAIEYSLEIFGGQVADGDIGDRLEMSENILVAAKVFELIAGRAVSSSHNRR